MDDPLLEFLKDRITDWDDFRLVSHGAFVEGSFRAVAVVGPQGAGKTTFAVNAVLRRAWSIMRRYGIWLSSDVDPLSDDFNFFEEVNERMRFSDLPTNRRMLSIQIARSRKVVTPLELLHFVAAVYIKQRQDKFGLVVDETALWSRDVVSWWGGDSKIATEAIRHFVVNVRGATSLAFLVSQDILLIPSPMRKPIDMVVDIERFTPVKGVPKSHVVAGYVEGTIKLRSTRGLRSTSTESRYYKISSFRLKTYMDRFLLENDVMAKRDRLFTVLASRGKNLGARLQPLRPKAMVEGIRFLWNFLGNAYEVKEVAPNVVEIYNVTSAATVARYLRTMYRDVIDNAKTKTSVSPSQRADIIVVCRTVKKRCYEQLRELARAVFFT